MLIDIWPQDRRSRCWADMTRTFVAGGAEASGELREYWELTRASLAAVMPALAPGAVCRDIFDLACEPFEAAGQPAVRTKDPGLITEDGAEVLTDFPYSLDT